ncbi:MAG TPA: glycosyltransferase [Candidatus Saccharimonadia bacterium]|nr:glycosyltransferase [Candidatus Saccharimonadia bacterium]
MKLSVIIPCLNEEHYLPRLLDGLLDQTMKDFEVVVVDSGSTDGTAAVAQSYANRLALALIQAPRGVARDRNAGAAASTGQWLLFLDADVRLPRPEFLAEVVTQAEARGLYTASAKFRIKNAGFMERVGGVITYQYTKLLSKTQHPVACGFCILTRRDRFEAVGGFDVALAVGEDYDYVSRSSGGRPNHFAFIGSTYFYVDLRRFEEGGRYLVFLKSIGYEIYRFTHGFRIDRDPFGYTFGQHRQPPTDTPHAKDNND